MTTNTNTGSLGFFTGVPQYKNLASSHLTQSVSLMPAAAKPFELPTGQSISLPETYAVVCGRRYNQISSVADR